jgi:threonine dehydrogenase-like Zn-dependent dehydrogenase
MRALVLSDFGRLQVQERPLPEPGPHEVVVAVIATGICGSDIHGFTGENGRRHPGQVMGHETVGRVSSIGAAVTGIRLGQPVTVNPVVLPDAARDEYAGREQHCPDKYVIGVRADRDAAFADYLVAPARNLVALADDTPILLGALIEPLAVAVHAVRRAGVFPGERVLVIGGGPIGQSVALALMLSGVAAPVVAELDAARRALLEQLGARALDAATPDFPAAVAALLGGPADVVIDAVGIDRTLANAFAASRLGATICLVGMGATSLVVEAFRISTDERTLVGSFTYSDDDFREAARLVALAPERAGLLISRTVGVDQAQEAFVEAARGEAPAGKTLVRFSAGAPA